MHEYNLTIVSQWFSSCLQTSSQTRSRCRHSVFLELFGCCSTESPSMWSRSSVHNRCECGCDMSPDHLCPLGLNILTNTEMKHFFANWCSPSRSPPFEFLSLPRRPGFRKFWACLKTGLPCENACKIMCFSHFKIAFFSCIKQFQEHILQANL